MDVTAGAHDPDQAPGPPPLAGVRVLALEQMQALPYATQLLGRLGAEVIKVESPHGGDQGRGSLPAMTDPAGRRVGATFLRNNLDKRSVCIDLKHPRGRRLVLDLAPRFDVVAENFKAGAAARLGLGYDDLTSVHPACIYLSISGFGTTVPSPYGTWPAFAPIVEAMSGIYEIKRRGDEPPLTAPVGGLGDLSAALFAVIGVLAALRHRDATGEGQYIDIAMLDSVVAMTDVVMNFWSLGQRGGQQSPLISHGFRAGDGWIIIQTGREHQFAALMELIGHPDWVHDERFSTRQGWLDHLEDVLRPAIEKWAESMTRMEACAALGRAGIAAGPCLRDDEVADDPHLRARQMVVEIPRVDGVGEPVLTPGNPIRMPVLPHRTEGRVPWLGEHTDEILTRELALGHDQLRELHEQGVIA
jgi:crotonobetainyl-CoA:carnitine CoA-transferase CaiB-like acyl-CoA transferase